ncbi:MAG: hypothetical protein BGO43_00215 [Gammaproteobacteria bacterium 39-13]|nr:DUF308 domain-containing protein [Gammaproteobacteria bacterium]OJV96687.1 MAG: hypothetical protein BGO43_00215 [Gammaproteobacteria bacterium 39-13]
MKNLDLTIYPKNWGWLLAWGIGLLILGALAISAAAFTTLLSIIFLGALFLCGGVVITVNTLQFWRSKGPGFSYNLIMGILYIILGLMFMFSPVPSAVSLTVLLAIFFIFIGISRAIFSLIMRYPSWGWSFASGLITLILGVMIIAEMPASSLFIIGLFVGIDMMFFGWGFIMAALYARSVRA